MNEGGPTPKLRSWFGRLIIVVAIVALLGMARLVMDSPEQRPEAAGSAEPSSSEASSPTSSPATSAAAPISSVPPDPGSLRFTRLDDAFAGGSSAVGQPDGEAGEFAGGGSVVDFDGDGHTDVLVTRIGLAPQLYRGAASGAFTLDTAMLPDLKPADPASGFGASLWFDADGDSDFDLFLGGVGRQSDVLLINDDGRLVDESAKRGVTTGDDVLAPKGLDPNSSGIVGLTTLGAAAGDWDRDGDLDLLVARWSPVRMDPTRMGGGSEKTSLCELDYQRDFNPNMVWSALLDNDGSGGFRDVTEKAGLDLVGVSALTPLWTDLNDDGWSDLVITGDYCSSRVFQNDQGRGFEDVTEALGAGTDENAMGSVVEDLDGDGRLDWFVSSIFADPEGPGCRQDLPQVGCTGNRSYTMTGGGTFTDSTDALGVRNSDWAWGAVGEDLDNDGWRDLAVVNGYETPAMLDANSKAMFGDAFDSFVEPRPTLWRGGADGPWGESAAEVGFVGTGLAKSLATVDVDGDGDLDLVVGNSDRAPQLFRNETPQGNHWLRVDLQDPTTPNAHGIGARVELRDGSGASLGVSEVRGGGSYLGSALPEAHFGLGTAERVASVAVRWPNVDEVDLYPIDTVDESIAIVRGSTPAGTPGGGNG
jgi:hypothetical protein